MSGTKCVSTNDETQHSVFYVGTAIPAQAPVEVTRFQDDQQVKVVKLPVLSTRLLYTPGYAPGTHFCQRLSQPQGHSAIGRIMTMKNSNDTTGNHTPALQVCSTVPQPTAPCTPIVYFTLIQ
jgi:hypothetical protein